jgi:hypothetical protein
MERAAPLQGLFYISLKFPIKISLNIKKIPSLKVSKKGAYLHVPQKRGPMERDPHFQSLIQHILRSPQLSSSPSRCPSLSSLEERCTIPRALLHSSFKVPGIRDPFQVPEERRKGRYERTKDG